MTCEAVWRDGLGLRHGLSWQIVPTMLYALLADPDRRKAGRVMEVMLKMKKLDIKALQQAYKQAK